jgi:hypothetical protein
MDPDFALVLGLFFGLLAAPNLIGSFSRGEPPRLAAIFIIIAGMLIAWASTQKPGGYSGAEIPGIVARVIRDLVS